LHESRRRGRSRNRSLGRAAQPNRKPEISNAKGITMAEEGFTPALSHFGISVFDIELMKNFYTKVFGFKVNDEGPGVTFNFRLVFLSSRPDVHHELVLAENRPADCSFSTVMQLSFKVQTLDQLRAVRRAALDNGARKLRGLNHVNALSIYFDD